MYVTVVPAKLEPVTLILYADWWNNLPKASLFENTNTRISFSQRVARSDVTTVKCASGGPGGAERNHYNN